ncbi:hypothetical protein Tco_0041634 [Tanacetum coccineum]
MIVVHVKNEAVYEEDIAFLKYDVQVKDIYIKDLKNQLEEAGSCKAKHIECRQAKRGWDTKIPQSCDPPEKVSDEVVHKELGDIMERAATTTYSLEAE